MKKWPSTARGIGFVFAGFLLSVSMAFADEAGCDGAKSRAVAAAVQAHYDTVKTFSADFEQVTESVVLGTPMLEDEENDPSASRGRVLFAKPGKMLWHYQKPEESWVIADGKLLWLYDVGAGQATRMPVGQEILAGAALQFLLGDGNLLDSFRIHAFSCAGASVALTLEPLRPASYEQLGLVARAETGEISETSIVDLFGNRTRIRFSEVSTNQPIPSERFLFSVPEGVEVIDFGS
ncbi:outer membrane lipoprotein carrier protein LolA [Myxococcota bacterium]|nr:outer membrane lipoprotein carrier protein LolA [Myxococcota bacterium]